MYAGKLNFPTPFYNSIIRHDLVVRENEELRGSVFRSNTKFKDAFILLKIWTRQRNLDEVNLYGLLSVVANNLLPLSIHEIINFNIHSRGWARSVDS